jgi:cobalt-zinc-cadmium efflux system protein
MHVHAKPNGSMQRILKFSLALTLLYIVATLFFGLRAHSLALISEAGHNVSDFVNALSLMALAVWIALAAIHRFYTPVVVEPHLMMSVAAAGVVMNGLIAGLLWKFSGDVNIRSVFLHMLGDTLSTAAVILGGLGIMLTHQQWIDPLLSLIIAAMIVWSS